MLSLNRFGLFTLVEHATLAIARFMYRAEFPSIHEVFLMSDWLFSLLPNRWTASKSRLIALVSVRECNPDNKPNSREPS